ncbi:MAG: hypothetical protein U9O55_04650 [Patescibacteria group bacterium]|nr:hypothetical protein [Patescibacteria group bacterium]
MNNERENIVGRVKPYYEDIENGISIYNANCFDVLGFLGEKTIDLVLTDPPYG